MSFHVTPSQIAKLSASWDKDSKGKEFAVSRSYNTADGGYSQAYRMDKHPEIAPEGDSGTMDSGPTWSNYEPWHSNPFYLAATY